MTTPDLTPTPPTATNTGPRANFTPIVTAHRITDAVLPVPRIAQGDLMQINGRPWTVSGVTEKFGTYEATLTPAARGCGALVTAGHDRFDESCPACVASASDAPEWTI